eukprot:897689-Amphidinium_carterae.1
MGFCLLPHFGTNFELCLAQGCAGKLGGVTFGVVEPRLAVRIVTLHSGLDLSNGTGITSCVKASMAASSSTACSQK